MSHKAPYCQWANLSLQPIASYGGGIRKRWKEGDSVTQRDASWGRFQGTRRHVALEITGTWPLEFEGLGLRELTQAELVLNNANTKQVFYMEVS